jgi:GTP-binding protein
MQINSANFETSAPDLRQCPAPLLPEFAFIGRSNVGKSSLINMLTMKKGLAKVSETPGKTQLINFFTINRKWGLVDLPGYGFARVSKNQRVDFNIAVADFLEKRETLRHTYVLIDSRLPPQAIDVEFIRWLLTTAVPFSLVFTKADKQSATKTQVSVQRFRKAVLATVTPAPAIFISSAEARTGRKEILGHISGLLG